MPNPTAKLHWVLVHLLVLLGSWGSSFSRDSSWAHNFFICVGGGTPGGGNQGLLLALHSKITPGSLGIIWDDRDQMWVHPDQSHSMQMHYRSATTPAFLNTFLKYANLTDSLDLQAVISIVRITLESNHIQFLPS